MWILGGAIVHLCRQSQFLLQALHGPGFENLAVVTDQILRRCPVETKEYASSPAGPQLPRLLSVDLNLQFIEALLHDLQEPVDERLATDSMESCMPIGSSLPCRMNPRDTPY